MLGAHAGTQIIGPIPGVLHLGTPIGRYSRTMRVPIEDMLLVIRGAGERTEAACEAIVRRLVTAAGGNPASQMVVVRERPFSKAVRATLELGRDGGRAWVIAIDADVLLLDDAIERLQWVCACADGAAFAITPLLLCKFYGGICCKGVHVYPQRLLGRAIGLIEQSGSAEDLKPESAVVRAMGEKGFRAQGPPVVVGVHDYEQSFRHIYLKARLRARREAGDPEADSFQFVRGLAGADADMLVASWGMQDGRADATGRDAPNQYSWDEEYPELEARMRAHGIREKPAWNEDATGYAERVIGSHDLARDARTPVWIRERFGFAGDRATALRRLGVRDALGATPEHSQSVRRAAS